jgi:Domain of unknown function (DUF4062)
VQALFGDSHPPLHERVLRFLKSQTGIASPEEKRCRFPRQSMRRDTTLDRPPVEHLSNVFISGTYDDLEDIRKQVAEAIKIAGQGPLEPHYTGGAHEDIREKVRRQIHLDAHLYVGVFGLRYGTRVSSEQDAYSYSHFEYLVALEKWKTESPPPIAVFSPDPVKGLDFYNEVKARCDAALKEKYGDDLKAIDGDKQRQLEFLEFVKRPNGDPTLGNRMMNYVTSLTDLRERVVAWIGDQKVVMLLLYAHQLRERLSEPPKRVEPETTRWSLQLEQAKNIHSSLDRTSATKLTPGVCLLVHGARSQGQSGLASLIADAKFWNAESDPVLRELEKPSELNDQAIWQTLWEAAGYYPDGDWADTDELAKRLLEAERPLIVVVRQIQLLKKGVRGFAERIWQPVYDSFERASHGRAPDSLDSRLIMVVTYEGGEFELENSIGCDADLLPGTANFRQILRLAKMP